MAACRSTAACGGVTFAVDRGACYLSRAAARAQASAARLVPCRDLDYAWINDDGYDAKVNGVLNGGDEAGDDVARVHSGNAFSSSGGATGVKRGNVSNAGAAVAQPAAPHPADEEDVDAWEMPAHCHTTCRWAYASGGGGPPGVAFVGAPLNQYVCPTMFRDLADWVYSFPYKHFGEKVTTPTLDAVIACLRPGAFIYSQTGPQLKHFANAIAPRLVRKFVLITGQSDTPPTHFAPHLLNSPNLLLWFAQNRDSTHPKMRAIPIGLNW
jgi:hypothetical protein